LGNLIRPAKKIKRGYITAISTGLLFPVTTPFYLVAYATNEALVHWNRRPKNKAKWGHDSIIGIEMLATLIIIPTVGLVASIGTSWAFYQLSATPSQPGHLHDAWLTLAATLILSFVLIVMAVRELARHQSGIEVFPFERDAKPSVALKQLRELRSRAEAGFLPGRYREASRWIDEICADENRIESFTRRVALRRLLRTNSVDIRQFIAVIVSGFISMTAAIFLIWSALHPSGSATVQWQLTGLTILTFIIFVAALTGTIACRLLLEAYRHQRLEKRIQVMELRVQEDPESAGSSVNQFQSLHDQLVSLTAQIEQLRVEITGLKGRATPTSKVWRSR
jgi:uncharacterized membrane protein